MIQQLHQTQAIVAKDNHDFRVVDCGRQWGKTTLAVEEMKACGYYKKVIPNVPHNEIAYFATTFDQARNIAWAMLKDSTQSAWDRPPNESRLELWLRTKNKELSRVTLRGFENIETARGQQFDLLVIDEVAFMRNWKYAWQSILEPTLAFRKGKALFISTPQGFNHFYNLYELGQTEDKYYKSWKFTSYENPFLSKERIEQAKVTSTPDYFAQEYMADFRKHTGLAHKNWDRAIHLLEDFDIPSTWQRARGFDFGELHFTASVRVAIDQDDNWFVENCYLNNTANVKGHADAILAEDYSFGFVPKWGDPSGKQWISDFKLYEVNIEIANKEVGQGFKGWVEYCVERVNERLKPIPGHTVKLPNGKIIENAPRLFIVKNGKTDKFISQIEMLSWKETATGDFVPILEDTGDPTGGHYDLMAALRYLAVSYVKPQKINYNDSPGGVMPFIPGLG
jgi:hypothetical protein